MSAAQPQLTVGTAGHIDHGKTALVQALTGVDTDRLPEEQTRGITIVLGYARLRLPSGRTLSLVDVPGHERLIRVMVSGATGIDLFLMVIAADDGVMPQTTEHIRVLKALEVSHGVVAITKSDLADPDPAAKAAARLLPAAQIVPCSSRSGAGVGEVAAALERVAASIPARSGPERATVLHIDRVFTIKGAGTVVTGTLWSGIVRRGDRLTLLPGSRSVRVRGVHVHDQAVEAASSGQRVALNLAGVDRQAVSRGDVLAGNDAPPSVTYRLETQLALSAPLNDRERVQLHHGTRHTPARAISLGGGRWEMRMEHPLIAAAGDRLVIRRISPPDTVGGGLILNAAGGRRGAPDPNQPRKRPTSDPRRDASPALLDAGALALEERLRAAGVQPLSAAELGAEVRYLPVLHSAERAVRVGRSMHAHPETIAQVRAVVEQVIAADGSITLSRLRDELGTSRKYAQALLEHLDAARVTRRLPDDTRVLRKLRPITPAPPEIEPSPLETPASGR
ncbi:MAG: selenocysteine-specific translation elongation factor [Solirubrobacteraceae bacterium]